MACIVCVDFDGVLHSYTSGWKGACVIPDPPVPGALEWLISASQDPRLEVCVYSSRSKEPGAIHAMKEWLRRYIGEFVSAEVEDQVLARLTFPTQKPAASMTIDDRAFCFEGSFPTIDWILEFKPWNKRGRV